MKSLLLNKKGDPNFIDAPSHPKLTKTAEVSQLPTKAVGPGSPLESYRPITWNIGTHYSNLLGGWTTAAFDVR